MAAHTRPQAATIAPPYQDNPLYGKAVRQHAEGQVGQGDAQDHRRDGVRGLGRADAELLLQDGQHRLGNVNRREGRGHQAENQGLKSEEGLPIHLLCLKRS